MGHHAVVSVLKKGGVAILPTDTIYGMVGSALKPKTVARIYRLRQRNRKKPMIVLIASFAHLRRFGVMVTPVMRRVLKKCWPGKVSVILPCRAAQFAYLHRGTGTIAFRLPKKPALRMLLRETGPLVAPSANREGEPPAGTVGEAKMYFGARVGAYLDGGMLRGKPSKLMVIEKGKLVRLR